jgi:D-threo-aldose 1-dehydrogenase
VDAVGLAVNQAQAVAPLLSAYDLDIVLLAGSYTLLETSALDEALPMCLERGVSVVVGGAFNSGILVTGPIPGARYDYRPPPEWVIARVRRLGEIALRHGVELGTAALHFPLAHPAVSSVIVGAASPDEVCEDIRLFGSAVPDGFWSELRRSHLLRGNAPVPADSSL